MNRFDIINKVGDKHRIGNTETGEFSYAALFFGQPKSGISDLWKMPLSTLPVFVLISAI